MEQALNNPSCKACSGTGEEAWSKCTVCKGVGRMPLDHATATPEDWVRWIREQPSVAHGVEVLKLMLEVPAQP